MEREGAAVACNERLFHRRAAATGNALDRRVRRTSRDVDEAGLSRRLEGSIQTPYVWGEVAGSVGNKMIFLHLLRPGYRNIFPLALCSQRLCLYKSYWVKLNNCCCQVHMTASVRVTSDQRLHSVALTRPQT